MIRVARVGHHPHSSPLEHAHTEHEGRACTSRNELVGRADCVLASLHCGSQLLDALRASGSTAAAPIHDSE